MYAGNALPQGYMDCDGSSLSRTEYAELFSAIGTLYGSDSGTTFKVPDFNGRFAEGTTASPGTYKSAGLPNIEGALGGITTNPNSTSDNRYSAASGPFSMTNCSSSVGPTGNSSWWMAKVTFDASDANEVYGNSETVQPKSVGIRFLIKYI